MSTIKVNEVRHLDNTGTANLVLESTGATTLKSTTIASLEAESVTVSGNVNLNGNTQVGNASTDALTLTATTKGSVNYSGFTGEVRMWSGTTAPTTWLICNGETIGNNSSGATHTPSSTGIASLQDLFDHLKTAFGNAGTESYANNNTVKLPDLKGRTAIGVGQQSNTKWNSSNSTYTTNGTNFTLGTTGGFEEHVIVTAEMATHNHTGNANSQATGVTASTTLNLSLNASGAHNHDITDPSHSHAHTHDFSHTHNADSSNGLTADSSTTSITASHSHTHSIRSMVSDGYGDFNTPLTTAWSQLGDRSETDLSGNYGPSNGFSTNGASTDSVTVNDSGHTHDVSGYVSTPQDFNGNANITTDAASSHAQSTGITVDTKDPTITVTDNNSSATTTITDTGHAHSLSIATTGSDNPHNNLQPYLALNYIIKI